MATSKVFSATNIGYDGRLIDIECDTTNGLPSITIVGLANKSIDEAKERIRSSIKNSDLVLPRKKITLNLAPADIPKDGSAYDLPMAIAILAAGEQIKTTLLKDSLFVGELSLEGTVRSIRGAITFAETARQNKFKRIFVPDANAKQAALVEGVDVIGVKNLEQLCKILNGIETLSAQPVTKIQPKALNHSVDFSDVYGQETAKRGIEIAAAGHHNILLNGPPGAGKTMMARAMLSIMPTPTIDEIIAITKLHSLAGELTEEVHLQRPFRSPHHTSSSVALIGGGRNPKPGEISLANRGILFMDELPEYTRSCLEALRQPLEDRIVTVARAQDTVTFPADFMLVATQNPCPCGYYMDPDHNCSCTANQINQYNKKISGPLLDRIDLVINVKKVDHKHLLPQQNANQPSQSEAIKNRIATAKSLQKNRFNKSGKFNAHMNNREISQIANLTNKSKLFLEEAAKKLGLSARGYMKVIRVARTIADLSDSQLIENPHIGEALQYRPRKH